MKTAQVSAFCSVEFLYIHPSPLLIAWLVWSSVLNENTLAPTFRSLTNSGFLSGFHFLSAEKLQLKTATKAFFFGELWLDHQTCGNHLGYSLRRLCELLYIQVECIYIYSYALLCYNFFLLSWVQVVPCRPLQLFAVMEKIKTWRVEISRQKFHLLNICLQ